MNLQRSAISGWGDWKERALKKKIWGSQCFSDLKEMCQPRDALFLIPKGFETELNLSSVMNVDHLYFTGCTIPCLVSFDFVMEDVTYIDRL